MLKIFLCEDNKPQRDRFITIIEDYLAKKNVDIHLELATDNPLTLLEYIENENSTGLYFLDIDLKNTMNGIELAKTIRNKYRNAFIVFITTHSEMTFLTFQYKVEPLDFIVKDSYDNLRTRIEECIDVSYKRYLDGDQKGKTIKIKVDDMMVIVQFDEIIFFETTEVKHKIRIHMVDRQIEFSAELKEIEKLLDDRFLRCHKSFIINKNRIKSLDTKNSIVYLENDASCFFSRSAKKELIQS